MKLSKNDAELIRHIQSCGMSNSVLVRKSLEMYFSVVNQNYREKNEKKVNHNICSVNQIEASNKHSNNVKYGAYTEESDLIRLLQEENEWLKHRVEYYEKIVTQYLDNNHNNKPKPPYQKNRSSVRF
ncbi:MAG: hypothetical protein KKC68_02650 [Candidatus Thermoplasmatota archaeon]|nr:hypothetical protein [Candidatus Thermoplasmatota archaeon]